MAAKQLKHIIEGFSDDIQSIAEKFAANYPQCQLLDFLKLWDEEHMDCLFANRFDPRELIEAISEMNLCLTNVLISSSDQDVLKVTAIYLLLCIFIKQPERFRSRFRWTCHDLLAIESWCNATAEKYNNSDPKQALKQLKNLKAFDLVEEREIYGPSMIRRGAKEPREKTNSVSSPIEEERKDTIEFLEAKIEPALQDLMNIHLHYDHFRQALELNNYQEISEQANTNTGPGVYLDQAANSIAEFKSNLQQ